MSNLPAKLHADAQKTFTGTHTFNRLVDALQDESGGRPDIQIHRQLILPVAIVSSTKDGANFRWTYTVQAKALTAPFTSVNDNSIIDGTFTAFHLFEWLTGNATEALVTGTTMAALLVTYYDTATSTEKTAGLLLGGGGGEGLPPGTAQYKVLQLNATNEPIWDWVRAAPEGLS